MTQIESKKVSVNASQNEIFEFLRDLNNFIELLPQDKISDWNSDNDSCSFKVTGGYKIGLRFKEAVDNKLMILESTDVSPFKFDLNIHLTANDSGTEAYQVCDADINAFLKMMVEKPLRNLFNYIADKLSEKYA